MKKFLYGAVCALLFAPLSLAQMNGQLIECDTPHPTQPDQCPDNWALDVLDESKTAIQSASGALPRDRKHYFDANGSGVYIFMLDTGIDANNPDFKALDNPGTSRISTTSNLTISDSEGGSHGTRTASLAAGLQYGVAKGATLVQVKASGVIRNNRGDALLQRLDWVYDRVTLDGMHPAVLNMSFNIPRPITDLSGVNMEAQLDQRVRDLIAAGVVVTVSAGNKNSGNPAAFWPTNVSEVILVGGLNQNGDRWVRDTTDPDYQSICLDPQFNDCGSNYGSLVDIWAPAEYVRAAVRINNRDDLAPRVRSGTSFAAPLVAGLAALRLQQAPWETPAQVRSALLANAAYLGDVDFNGTADYMARSPVGTPACNVPQRMFVNSSQTRRVYSSQMRDSCPAGYDAFAQYNALNGTVSLWGLGPDDAVYGYDPNSGYVGLDQFNYTIYNSTGGVFGNGTVKVTVQPDHN